MRYPQFSLRTCATAVFRMADFAAALSDANMDFSDASISSLDPQAAANDRSQNMALASGVPLVTPNITGFQGAQKCLADYNQLPYGWRPSPFMGECGFKIQLKKFYEGDSPCYPVQDLSCMGPREKQAWANICATEFPCGSPPAGFFKAQPGEPTPRHLPHTDLLAAFVNTVYEYAPIIVGISALSCCFVRSGGSTKNAGPNSDTEETDGDDSKPN